MNKVTARANAKVNLTLFVTGRRDDGYHTLSTVMHSVELFDEVTAEKAASGISLMTDDENIPTDRRNTAFRAAEEFFKASGISGGVRLFLKKQAPYEAGLGSASADAAAALLSLDALYPDSLDSDGLFEAAKRVGADVPFCLTGGAALCEGTGEVITKQRPLQDCAFLIVKPSVGISTSDAYRAVDSFKREKTGDSLAMCRALERGDTLLVSKLLENDFTPCCGLDEVHEIIAEMKKHGALGSEMSGSGSAVFGIFPDIGSAEGAAAAMGRRERRAFAVLPADKGIVFL